MAENYKLLKTQKNEVFQFLQQVGLEPANFSWTEEPSILNPRAKVFRLNYGSGLFYFQFDFAGNIQQGLSHYCEYSPAEDVVVVRQHPGDWRSQICHVNSWLECLKREVNEPDLWAEMEKYTASMSLALPEQLLNEPIPAYKAEEIASQLKVLASKIDDQLKLDAEQSQFVHGKLDYLAEAAKRQRSTDWVHTSIGVCVTIAVSLALAPDKAQQLWQLMKGLLGPFIHLLGS